MSFLRYLLLLLAFLFPPRASAYFANFQKTDPYTLSLGDWTTPTTKLWFQQNDKRIPLPPEEIVNGSFADGLAGWTSQGQVQQIEDGVQLGSEENTIDRSSISQLISNKPTYLYIRYKLFSLEDDYLCDTKALSISVDDAETFSVPWWSSTNDWQELMILLPHTEQETRLITIEAGNTGDFEHPSWVQISTVSTALPIVSSQSQIIPEIVDNSPTTTSITLDGDQFSLFAPGAHSLSYFSEDDAGNKEAIAATQVFGLPDPESISIRKIYNSFGTPIGFTFPTYPLQFGSPIHTDGKQPLDLLHQQEYSILFSESTEPLAYESIQFTDFLNNAYPIQEVP
jgi:hypothetical protein